MVEIINYLWNIFKIVGLFVLILTIIKVFIEEWFIKPIKRKKLNESIKKAVDELIEEIKEEELEESKSKNKTTKKTTKKRR